MNQELINLAIEKVKEFDPETCHTTLFCQLSDEGFFEELNKEVPTQ